MDFFCRVSLQHIKDIIIKSPCKNCKLDPISTEHLKYHLDAIGPLIEIIVIKSLQSGVAHQDFKKTLVWPPLKKSNMDLLDKYFHPVSN